VKIILAQPAILRFQWELDVALTNIRSLDKNTPIVVLFTEDNMGVVHYIQEKYSNIEVHHYPDERSDKRYTPTVRPYLWWKYLNEDSSREKEVYLQIDSDVIFREMPKFKKMKIKSKECVASDCEGYLNYEYLNSRTNGEMIIKGFARILNISTDVIKQTPGAGAQWIISQPTSQYFYHVWKDSDLLYNFLQPIDSDIQKWTAEMWAQLYNLPKFGYRVRIHPELDFCRPTDSIKMWDVVKIMHNAGVVGDQRNLFFKGKYVSSTPFTDDLSFVRKDKVSIKYVEAIKSVVV